MNLFDLPGPQFLGLYTGLLIGAALGGLVLRRVLRTPGDLPYGATAELDPYETAYLAGGRNAAVNAALTTLVHRGLVRFKASRGFVMQQPTVATHVTSKFEAGVYRIIESGRSDVMEIRRAARPLVELLSSRLRDLQLVYPMGSFGLARVMPALVMSAVLVVGIIKISVGLSRERPVLYLVLLSLLALFGTILFLRMPLLRTRRGDGFLSRIRSRNTALRTSAATMPSRLGAADVALATALFGPQLWTSGPVADVSQELRTRRDGHSGSSCGSGCSGGSSSSCSGAGGSCGGGGCGGCGGGCGGGS